MCMYAPTCSNATTVILILSLSASFSYVIQPVLKGYLPVQPENFHISLRQKGHHDGRIIPQNALGSEHQRVLDKAKLQGNVRGKCCPTSLYHECPNWSNLAEII